MDDMTTFEVQLSTELDQMAGPGRDIDAAAMVRTVATQSSGWKFGSMFSATTFVFAGVIVALFGGFLLSGVLTQQENEPLPPAAASAPASPEAVPSAGPTATPVQSVRSDLLPGVDLSTEEVQPGVLRVLSDGVRELSNVPMGAAADDESAFWDFLLSPSIAAGRDSVWWFGPDEFFRLGDDRTHDRDGDELRPYSEYEKDIEIAPDGTLWVADPGLQTFDGASWADVRPRSVSVEIDEDGTVWSAWQTPNGKGFVGRLIDGAWERLGGQLPQNRPFGGLSLGDDGSPWVVTGGALFHHLGEGWRRVDTPSGVPVWGAVAPDGTRWVQLQRKDKFVLARHDGDGWTVDHTLFTFDGAMGASYPKVAQVRASLRVAPDGGLWANHVEGPNGRNECRGVTRFGEGEPRHFLGDLCVLGMDVAPDGNVWLQAGEVRDVVSTGRTYESLGPTHTYVITPEAVAAAK